MPLRVTLDLEERDWRDHPDLGLVLAEAKHHDLPVTLTVQGFGYDVEVRRVQLEQVPL